MALIECPECYNEVSDRAESCPDCGYPINQEPGCPECGSHDLQRLAHLYECSMEETTTSGLGLTFSGMVGIGSATSVTTSPLVERLMQEHLVPERKESGFSVIAFMSIVVGFFAPPIGLGIFLIFGTITGIIWLTQPSKKKYEMQLEEFYSKFICNDCGEVHRRVYEVR
jgi:hypothetical protein